MKEYTVAYMKNGEECAYSYYSGDTPLEVIIEDLTYKINRYGNEYDEVAIFDTYDEEIDTVYYEVVETGNIDERYELLELV